MICEALQPSILIGSVLSAWEPRPDVRTWDWICENGRMHNGQPFDGDRVPWLEGVCDAYDDPVTRTITEMWGTRLGKTSGAFQIMACKMATAPMPGLFGSSTQTLIKKTVSTKIYPILRAIAATREQLPNEKRQSWEKIKLDRSTWNVSWSGSATTLADVEAFYGHAGEVDKWTFNEMQGGDAGEGDSLDQFLERFKEFSDHKIIIECSPSTAQRSRIYKRLKASNNCRYNVPCPKCRKRQVLKMGGRDAHLTGGIVFDKLPDGSFDRDLARESARYVCEHCRKEIYDEQRFAMMRSGVWVPEGCYADRRGRVIGTPLRSPRHWGSQLSSLYSLQLRWGDIAAKFVESKDNPNSLRMFKNGWEAEVWEPYRSKSEPEDVAERMKSDVPTGKIPLWATWVFRGIDVQEEFMVHVTIAVGPGERLQVIERGIVDTWQELDEIIKREYEHEDRGPKLAAALTLIDSGFRTKEVYDFCQKWKRTPYPVLPCKGANNDCNGEPYLRMTIGDGTKTGNQQLKRLALAARGLIRIRVNPFHYEPLIQKQIDETDEAKRLWSFAEEIADDFDFIVQVCNGVLSHRPSKTSTDQHLWTKRWDDKPNDYRDALKYARCAADLKFRGDWRRAMFRQIAVAIQQAAASPSQARTERESTEPRSGRGARRAELRSRMQQRREARRARR